MDLWYPAAQKRLGPPEKVWPDVNAVAGLINHSMGGGFESAMQRLDDMTQVDGFFTKPSWTFSIRKDGTVYQHYALAASPFHAGGHYWNARLVGVEHEGGAPGSDAEALTDPQLAASIALTWWIARQGGWTPSRTDPGKTLFEHGEVYMTACPSGRIPWDRYLSAQYPINTNVTATGFDTGLVRLREIDVVRAAARAMRQAYGEARDAHAAIDGAFNSN